MIHVRLRSMTLLSLALALAACGEVDGLDNSYVNDNDPSIFSAEAKADGLTLDEGGQDAAGVLRVANELSRSDLDDVVKLDARAAANIVAERDASGAFTTLRQLDAVKYVGMRAISRMRAYAMDAGWIGGVGDEVVLIHGVAAGSYDAVAILVVANDSSADVLDDEAALDTRAVSGIVAGRPFADLRSLDAASYVGARAFGRLLDFARSAGLVPRCGDGAVQAALETCDDGNAIDGDGCSAQCATEDGGDDGARVHDVLEGSDDALAILRVANTATLEALDDAAHLDSRAAAKIVDARSANGDFESLVALDAVPYVARRAFEQLLAYARTVPASFCGDGTVDDGEACDDGNHDSGDGCDAVCGIEEPAADAVIFRGEEQCSGEAWNTRYTYSVISNPPRAETDVRIAVRFNSRSPYSPRSQAVELEVRPNQWSTVFTTTPAVSSFNTQTFTLTADTANAAIDAMGWLRLRVNPGTFYTACRQLEVTYNCPECFACPAGQEDVGFGCQDIGAPFNQTLLDHSRGLCSRSSATLTFISAPEASSDGTLSLQYLPCDGGWISVSINTRNAGWVEVGTDSTGLSCGFQSANMTIPEAFLDAARNAAGEIELRYSISDSCRPGMGCASHNDPCVRRVNLQYEQ